MKRPTKIKIDWPNPGDTFTTETGMEYTIGGQISTNSGFGLLYKGYDKFENSTAIKILKPANRKFSEVRKQWEKETKILERVRHPNVIAIYDAFICGNLFYIVFERAGGDISHLIQQFGPQDETIVREIARQLLFALYYVHREEILHKDLTIYNVLFFLSTDKAVYKISDFGISEDFVNPLEDISTNPIAHRLFKPPELVSYGYTSRQSDLYHLGLILLYCLTGQFSYDINMPQANIDKAIRTGVPRKMAESFGTPFGQFISILLRRRDRYRFKNALEAWDYLKKIKKTLFTIKHKAKRTDSNSRQ